MKVTMCPHCRSKDIHLYMGGQIGMQYECNSCGYVGALIIEEDVTLDAKE